VVGLSRRKNIFEGGLSYADPRVKVPFMDQCEHSAVMPSPIFKFPQWRGFVVRDFPTIGLLFQEKHGLKALKAFLEKHGPSATGKLSSSAPWGTSISTDGKTEKWIQELTGWGGGRRITT